jgi:hypothetical protein
MPRARKQPDIDNRSLEQMETHVWGVRCIDRSLSGWGKATRGQSVVIYAFTTKEEAEAEVTQYTRRRDFTNCIVVDLRTYRFSAKHTRILIGVPYYYDS